LRPWKCSPDADRLSAEALSLGEDLDVDASQLGDLMTIRGIYLGLTDRRPRAIGYLRESARLAERAGDTLTLGTALLNLSYALDTTDLRGAVDTARTAAGHLRRVGAREQLASVIANIADLLIGLGDWEGAETELTQAVGSDALGDSENLAAHRGWLAALRGDAGTAETMLAALRNLRTSEAPQDQSQVSLVEAFTAAARGQHIDALRSARAALARAGAIGISHPNLRWAWPLAARVAYELRDTATTDVLLAQLDAQQPGHLAPMLRAERALARARQAAYHRNQAVPAAFTTAITSLREDSTPYHLAHGLLDHAEHLAFLGDADAAQLAIYEARDIGHRLHCQPLLDRAASMTPAEPKTPA
jgi:tetratricopeptide (TPR) repeat protein